MVEAIRFIKRPSRRMSSAKDEEKISPSKYMRVNKVNGASDNGFHSHSLMRLDKIINGDNILVL